jgi:hypothetical protein
VMLSRSLRDGVGKAAVRGAGLLELLTEALWRS